MIGFLSGLSLVFADNMGNTSTAGMTTASNGVGQIELARFTAATTGTLTSITLFVPSPSGNGNVGIYADSSGSLGSLIAQGSQQALSAQVTFTISGSVPITSGTSYWLAFETQSSSYYYVNGGSTVRGWAAGTCCTLPNSVSAGTTSGSYAIYATYTPPPTGPSITSSPSSLSVPAGGSVSSTLTLSNFPSGTVNLAVSSGCPTGTTCTITPNSLTTPGQTSATLSVSAPSTVAAGSYSLVVSATGAGTAQVTIPVGVTGAPSMSFNVQAGATHIIATVTWTGTGTATLTLLGPGTPPTPQLTEAGQTIYNRISGGSGATITNLHRVDFDISAYSPTSPQQWTVLISVSGSYTITVEVS